MFEQLAFPAGEGTTNLSSDAILSAAEAQHIPFVMIAQANLSSLGSLQISADARARITTAVEQGCVVLVPSQDATVSGTQAIAWMELSPATGQFSEDLEDGTRSADVEYAGVEDSTRLYLGRVGQGRAGRCSASSASPATQSGSTGPEEQPSCQPSPRELAWQGYLPLGPTNCEHPDQGPGPPGVSIEFARQLDGWPLTGVIHRPWLPRPTQAPNSRNARSGTRSRP